MVFYSSLGLTSVRPPLTSIMTLRRCCILYTSFLIVVSSLEIYNENHYRLSGTISANFVAKLFGSSFISLTCEISIEHTSRTNDEREKHIL
ncbi:hypothetical protein V1478_002309 [Vespula squamosa]|uniref:Uncharacterized protein n=1 Tax=Vespula squamosa TaxID=30214 RepID=A0ABD2BWF6_VESSQ